MKKLRLDKDTRSNRNQWSWTRRNQGRAADILTVMEKLKPWWPMTVRQVYYQLISSNLVKQDHWYWKGERVDIYSALTRILKWMRIDERLSWNAITDEHRTTTAKLGFTDVREFLEYELGNFLTGFNRCRAQKQEKYIEIWIEKAALLHIVQPVADEFCRRVVCCKGYNSITFQSKFYDRATEAIRMGQEPIVLYFGDWDPSGENMILAAMQTLTEELDLYGVTYHRCGINHEHFGMISADPAPLNQDDSRTKKFVEKFGKTAYELDAFHPLQLQDLVRESIREFTDMGVYSENAEQEYDDDDTIDEFKEEVLAYIYDKLEDYGL